MLINTKCNNCGNDIELPHYQYERGKHHYCSKECKYQDSLSIVIDDYKKYLNVDDFKSWIYQKYVIELCTVRGLMKLLNTKSNRTVMKVLKYYNIPIRHGSEAIKVQWINNDERKIAATEHAKKNLNSIESRKKLIAKMQTKEYRTKLREMRLGEKNPMYNPNLSEEDRLRYKKDKRDDE